MSKRGLNLTGVGDLAATMQKGYQDYLDLYNKDRALAMQQQQVDYSFPNTPLIPKSLAQQMAPTFAKPSQDLFGESYARAIQNQDPVVMTEPVWRNGVMVQAPKAIKLSELMAQSQGVQPSGAGRQPQGTFDRDPAAAAQQNELADQAMFEAMKAGKSQAEAQLEAYKVLHGDVGAVEESRSVAGGDVEAEAARIQQIADDISNLKGKSAEQVIDMWSKLVGASAGIYGTASRQPTIKLDTAQSNTPASSGRPSKDGLTPYERQAQKEFQDEAKRINDERTKVITDKSLWGPYIKAAVNGDYVGAINRDYDARILNKKYEMQQLFKGSRVGDVAPGVDKPSNRVKSIEKLPLVKPGYVRRLGNKANKTQTFYYPNNESVTVPWDGK